MFNFDTNYSNEPLYKQILSDVLIRAKESLSIEIIDESYADSGEGQHGNYYDASRPFADNIMYLCFAYNYLNDAKYAQKSYDMMMAYSSYKKWHGHCMGHSELNNAHFCNGMCIGFKMLGNFISESDKKFIAMATFEKGIRPIAEDWVLPNTRIHAMDTMGHNWWIVCVSTACASAIAMRSYIPGIDYYIDQLCLAIKAWFEYPGNALNVKPTNALDGGCYEGVSYLNFSLEEYCLFKYIYEAEYGISYFDDEKYLRGFAEFFAHTVAPSTKKTEYIKFGDCSKIHLMKGTLWMLGVGLNSPELGWYVRQWGERMHTVEELLFYDKIYHTPYNSPLEKCKNYSDIGWAIMRKSFDKDSPVLAVKCGDSWNHAHCDAGHFVFYNQGEPIVYDSGTSSYSIPEYLEYYTTSNAHNVVLFNGHGQDKRDFGNHVRMRGRIIDTDFGEFPYLVAECTGPMSRFFRRWLRHFLWVDGAIVIYDDIEAYEKGDVSLLLHIEQNYEDTFKLLTPHTRSILIGKKHMAPDVDVPYLCFNSTTDNDCRAKLISVLCEDSNIKVGIEKHDNAYEVYIGNTKVFINCLSDGSVMHANCINSMLGYTTDAELLCITDDAYYVTNASMLRFNGASLYDSLVRKNVLIKKEKKDEKTS